MAENSHFLAFCNFCASICNIFESALEAVHCAIALQAGLRQLVPLRIGIHLGEVVEEDGEIYGNSVNIAARIQQLGTPGSVLISDRLQCELFNQGQIHTRLMGCYELKNVKYPVKIFALNNPGHALEVQSRVAQELCHRLKAFFCPN